MQQMQGASRLGVVLIGLAVVIGGGVMLLMTRDIPAPQQAIEKPLDAKQIMEQKH
jgi:hypothetical protein